MDHQKCIALLEAIAERYDLKLWGKPPADSSHFFGDDHLIAGFYSKRRKRKMKAGRAIADGERIFSPAVGREFFLELVDVFADRRRSLFVTARVAADEHHIYRPVLAKRKRRHLGIVRGKKIVRPVSLPAQSGKNRWKIADHQVVAGKDTF
jgi:hypothetical protein